MRCFWYGGDHLDRLELLERLLAGRAIPQRPARGRSEDVLELGGRRAAVGTPEDVRLQLDERRGRCLNRRGGRETRCPELLAPLRRDPVGRPGVVAQDVDLRLRTQLADPLYHRVAHHLERRAAEERRGEVHTHVAVLDADVTDDSEVDERDHRDLGIRDLGKHLPHLVGGYHVVPAGCERRTIVISSKSSASSPVCSPRSESRSGRSWSSAAAKRGSSFSRSNHMCACMRWYASSRSIFAARPASSGSSDCFSCSRRFASASSYR